MGLRSNRGASFFEIFGQQAALLVNAMALLVEIFSTPLEQRKPLSDRLHEVEHHGDELNHQVINKLNQTFVTPFDREDLSAIASLLDDCMDLIDEAGDMLVLYRIDGVPDSVKEFMRIQMTVLSECAKLTAEAMPKLKDPASLRDYWVEINRLENDGDRAYRKTLTALFDSGIDPVDIIKMKDIVLVLERGADAFEDLANRVEAIAVKES